MQKLQLILSEKGSREQAMVFRRHVDKRWVEWRERGIWAPKGEVRAEVLQEFYEKYEELLDGFLSLGDKSRADRYEERKKIYDDNIKKI